MVLCLEEILIIECDFVSSQEFDVFLLKRFPPMMFFLARQISLNNTDLRMTDRKRRVPFLPFERCLAFG